MMEREFLSEVTELADCGIGPSLLGSISRMRLRGNPVFGLAFQAILRSFYESAACTLAPVWLGPSVCFGVVSDELSLKSSRL
jgi:hypothetical protein